jgi:hypothetical protein
MWANDILILNFRIKAFWKKKHLDKAQKKLENTLRYVGILCKEEVTDRKRMREELVDNLE